MSGKKPDVDVVKVKDLTPDALNANRHTERGMAALGESLTRHGFGRPALADKNLRMIAGNATLESVAAAAGIDGDVIIVRTRGDKMVVHVREDLDLDDPETRRLALNDNRVAEQNLDWDPERLQQLDAAGVDFAGLWNNDELSVIRAAVWSPPSEVELPAPQGRKSTDDERCVQFTEEQWKSIAAAQDKMQGEQQHSGIELSPADVLTILSANYALS